MKWILLYITITNNGAGTPDNGWMLFNDQRSCMVMAEKLKTEHHATFADCGMVSKGGGPTL